MDHSRTRAPYDPPSLEDAAKSDAYFAQYLLPKDPVLDEALENSRANGLPPEWVVSPAQGKSLKLIAQSMNAKRILEVGTLGGYSTIWLGRGLADNGKLISLEVSEKHAKVARENIERASLSSKVNVIVGPAAETLKSLSSDEPFDLIFIDADKSNIPAYFHEAKRLTRKGGMIVVDDANRQASVVLQPEDTENENVKAIRQLLEQLKDDKEVDAIVLNMAGSRGFDGMLYAVRQ